MVFTSIPITSIVDDSTEVNTLNTLTTSTLSSTSSKSLRPQRIGAGIRSDLIQAEIENDPDLRKALQLSLMEQTKNIPGDVLPIQSSKQSDTIFHPNQYSVLQIDDEYSDQTIIELNIEESSSSSTRENEERDTTIRTIVQSISTVVPIVAATVTVPSIPSSTSTCSILKGIR
jgi:hypothetical protein